MTECPSGKLSKTHLQRLFKRVFPVGDSENFCDYIFRLFDDDGNNVLEFKEFLQVSSIELSVATQCPRIDLNKKFLPRPKTTTA